MYLYIYMFKKTFHALIRDLSGPLKPQSLSLLEFYVSQLIKGHESAGIFI